ncbi:MAG TPA: potassium channel family protein [Bacteroidales bacterium]|nr:potassium channel family protein [Bacteroidales bacterium]
MTREYANYRVDLKNVKFIADDGRTFPRSAIITYLSKKGDELRQNIFGAPEITEIYRMIGSGEDLNLDNCYLRDFSLSSYRRHNGLDKKHQVALNNLSVKDCFFESPDATDFSYASFHGSILSFEGTHFAKGRVLFNGSKFDKCNVIFSNTLFRDGNIDFAGCHFGDGDFMFKNAIIKDGIKDFQDIEFGKGEVSFANTEFNRGEILFINTKFNSGRFDFKVARVLAGKVDFHYSVFGDDDVSFERAEFGDSKVDFRAVGFGSGRVNFNRSVFGNGEVSFEGASGNAGKIQFKKTVFGSGPKNFNLLEMENSDITFERSDFGDGDVSFFDAKLHSLSLRSCHLDHYFDLRVAKAEVLDISDTIVRDIIDLEPYSSPVDIAVLNMSGMRLPGKIYINWKRNRCKQIIEAQEETSLKQKAEQFRILKENFNGTGKYEDEDEAYVMFKRYEAKAWLAEKQEKGGISSVSANISHGFQWLVFDKIGLYATSPGRVLLSVLIFWLIFGGFYFLLEISALGKTVSSVGNPDNLSVLGQSFYHSAITFFTIGYGDVYPMGWSRIVSGLEGFIGVFMMSYFTVAFVRKVLR